MSESDAQEPAVSHVRSRWGWAGAVFAALGAAACIWLFTQLNGIERRLKDASARVPDGAAGVLELALTIDPAVHRRIVDSWRGADPPALAAARESVQLDFCDALPRGRALNGSDRTVTLLLSLVGALVLLVGQQLAIGPSAVVGWFSDNR